MGNGSTVHPDLAAEGGAVSTVAYAKLTSARDEAAPGKSNDTKPGVGKYVDALAALVPAEVLAAHAIILTFTTTTQEGADGASTTIITEPDALQVAFWLLLGASAALYFFAKLGTLDILDSVRILIPPLAFAGWAMLLTPTAFDPVNAALGLDWTNAMQSVVVVGGALILAGIATGLAYQADRDMTHANPG